MLTRTNRRHPGHLEHLSPDAPTHPCTQTSHPHTAEKKYESLTGVHVRGLMKRRVTVNIVQRCLSWVFVTDPFHVCVSPPFQTFGVCCVFVSLLQRSRHILEACRRGVVAIPRHAPERDQNRQEVGGEMKRDRGEEDQSLSNAP